MYSTVMGSKPQNTFGESVGVYGERAGETFFKILNTFISFFRFCLTT
jgi:hypothetical protein